MSLRRIQISRCSKPQNYYCDVCSVQCSSIVQLAEHLQGSKHNRLLQSIKPNDENDAVQLGNFLKAHVKEQPIVGMEYVTEVKKDSRYIYSCQLCKVENANLPTIVVHLTESFHTEYYIREHFTYLLPSSRVKAGKAMSAKVLRNAALKIVSWQRKIEETQAMLPDFTEDDLPSIPESDGKTQGASEDARPSKPERDGKTRKAFEDAPPSKPESDGKTQGASEDARPSKPGSDGKTRKVFEDTPPSKHKTENSSRSKLSLLPYQEAGLDENHESYRYNKMLQRSFSNDPPLAKRSRHSPGGDRHVFPSTAHISKHESSHYNKSHAVTMDCTATQELVFRTNDEFLEYLANFVISDDEDFLFIRTIAQNCIKALTRFQEEDAEREKTDHQPDAPLEDTSRTAREIPGILEDETKSHLSDSKTTLLEDNSNPPSDFTPKNEATDLFFNSIKNMDESEVVRDFQKIAATNPEFQGMDIPSVIRFLKDSGRLK